MPAIGASLGYLAEPSVFAHLESLVILLLARLAEHLLA